MAFSVNPVHCDQPATLAAAPLSVRIELSELALHAAVGLMDFSRGTRLLDQPADRSCRHHDRIQSIEPAIEPAEPHKACTDR